MLKNPLTLRQLWSHETAKEQFKAALKTGAAGNLAQEAELALQKGKATPAAKGKKKKAAEGSPSETVLSYFSPSTASSLTPKSGGSKKGTKKKRKPEAEEGAPLSPRSQILDLKAQLAAAQGEGSEGSKKKKKKKNKA